MTDREPFSIELTGTADPETLPTFLEQTGQLAESLGIDVQFGEITSPDQDPFFRQQDLKDFTDQKYGPDKGAQAAARAWNALTRLARNGPSVRFTPPEARNADNIRTLSVRDVKRYGDEGSFLDLMHVGVLSNEILVGFLDTQRLD